MKRSRPFGLEFLVEVTCVAAVGAVVATGCSGSKSTPSGQGSSIAPTSSVQTMAFSMPTAQYPSGDTM
jgi:hypothetical protein